MQYSEAWNSAGPSKKINEFYTESNKVTTKKEKLQESSLKFCTLHITPVLFVFWLDSPNFLDTPCM